MTPGSWNQHLLFSIDQGPLFVCVISFLDSAIVCDVLTECLETIDVLARVSGEVTILSLYTLDPLLVRLQ